MWAIEGSRGAWRSRWWKGPTRAGTDARTGGDPFCNTYLVPGHGAKGLKVSCILAQTCVISCLTMFFGAKTVEVQNFRSLLLPRGAFWGTRYFKSMTEGFHAREH